MDESLHLTKICGADEAVLDVLFLHGLTGDPMETWMNEAGDEHWPAWLCEALPNVAIYALGYPSSIFGKWAKQEMDLHERANNLLEQLASNGIGERPIAIIAHSLGGILTKEMLRTSNDCTDDGWQKISEQTKLVMFLATPHKGTALAAALKIAVPRLASRHVDLLTNDSGYLRNLNQYFRDFANKSGVAAISYYEKFRTKSAVLVVPEDSADPGVGTNRPIPIDADHISICKPKDRTALVFTSVCRHLHDVLKLLPLTGGNAEIDLSFAAEDYGAESEGDRRDLLRKLMDAGREHEYENANNQQSKFARRYHRLGLHTSAKLSADHVLASVQQRFQTHVYANKICKGAV